MVRQKILSIDVVKLFNTMATDCGLDPYTIQYCVSRLKSEGIKFWTVTLPKLARFVLHSLEVGFLDFEYDNRMISCFAWQGRSLRYFRSLLDGLFCRKTGEVLEFPKASSLASLRQLTEYAYKLALDFDQATLNKFEDNYAAQQEDLSRTAIDLAWSQRLRKNAETYYKALFKPSPSDILSAGPRFGPGSFAGSRTDIPYYVWKQLPDSVIGTCRSEFSPYSGYFKPYPGVKPTHYRISERSDERLRSEVLFVPKDSRGPRVISKEPPLAIKGQMAFFSFCSSALQNMQGFSGRINFTDQSINQRLARDSSITKSMATLDLKDASDRVTYKLVKAVLWNSPGIRWMLLACRSRTTVLPSGKEIQLSSLAGMGSGFTFPLLAFFVHLSICSRVSLEMGLPYVKVARNVYVYGDDVVVPTQWYEAAVRGLEASALKVNMAKSYKASNFRESCGADYFNGISVAPVRLRMQNSKPVYKDGRISFENYSSAIVALTKHTHELRKAYLGFTAEFLEGVLEQHIPMPYVGDGSPILGKLTDDFRLILSNKGETEHGVTKISCVSYKAKTLSSLSQRLCPYKHLSKCLARSPIKVNNLGVAVSDIGQEFGVIPIPRRIRLQYGSRSLLAAYPVVSVSKTS